MSKEIDSKSRLNPDNIPVPKKKKEKENKENLGLLNRRKLSQPIAFRMRPEVIDMLNRMVVEINKQSRIKLTKVGVLELCIMHAKDKTIEELMDFYSKNIV